jgi:heme A synthase
MYEILNNSNLSWECAKCGIPNYMDILVDLGWVQVHEFARSRLHRYVSTNLSCLMVLFFLMRQLREKEEISEVLFSLIAIVVDQELSGAMAVSSGTTYTAKV